LTERKQGHKGGFILSFFCCTGINKIVCVYHEQNIGAGCYAMHWVKHIDAREYFAYLAFNIRTGCCCKSCEIEDAESVTGQNVIAYRTFLIIYINI
jgi:hypothetical protein